MEELGKLKCVACRRGEPKATEQEIAEYISQIPEWKIIERDGIKRLERTYKFKDFSEALSWTNKVGELAEAEGHHPALLTEWGKVTVSWWTHKIEGLHRNDFIMAAKTDALPKA
jgi:4a-hydroxytetrahydrobiopterin dehydratase